MSLDIERKISYTWDQFNEYLLGIDDKKSIKVLTNGCFDILHIGHIHLLSQAKMRGHILIVGLNSDDSVRMLKGENRPYHTVTERAIILASIEFVDHVVVFNQPTAIELIQQCSPQVYIKGGDYTKDTLPEFELLNDKGIPVEFIEPIPHRSTSGLLKKIKH